MTRTENSEGRMRETIIIPWEERFLPAVYGLEKACFSTPWSENSFREAGENPDTTLLLLLDRRDGEETVIGFGCLMVVMGEGEILNIAVSPEHRREGLGQRLLSALLTVAEARRAENVYLEVREGNEPARALYEKNGFVPVGRRKRYYKNPVEDAILMCRRTGENGLPV